jgi:hypothetical protein
MNATMKSSAVLIKRIDDLVSHTQSARSAVQSKHKLRRVFGRNLRAQHGQRGSIRAIATTMAQLTVAMGVGGVVAGTAALRGR